MTTRPREELAIKGGPRVRKEPMPPRHLFGEEEKRAVIALFDKSIETGEAFSYNGPEEEAYCRQFAAFLGGGHADAVNSGTSAVYVALRALDIEPFTEVIVPSVSDMGGVMPVPLMNCIPVPADCAPGTYNMGPEQVEKAITERTSAIVVAHIAGTPADMGPIMEIARSRGVKVVEDCAQAHGARYNGEYVGTFGDIAAFSTMSGKHHATAAQQCELIGDGRCGLGELHRATMLPVSAQKQAPKTSNPPGCAVQSRSSARGVAGLVARRVSRGLSPKQ